MFVSEAQGKLVEKLVGKLVGKFLRFVRALHRFLSVQLRLDRWEYGLTSMRASSRIPMYFSQMRSRLLDQCVSPVALWMPRDLT